MADEQRSARPNAVKDAPIRRCTLPIRGIAGGGEEGKRRDADPAHIGTSARTHRASITIPQTTCPTPAISLAATHCRREHRDLGSTGNVFILSAAGAAKSSASAGS